MSASQRTSSRTSCCLLAARPRRSFDMQFHHAQEAQVRPFAATCGHELQTGPCCRFLARYWSLQMPPSFDQQTSRCVIPVHPGA